MYGEMKELEMIYDSYFGQEFRNYEILSDIHDDLWLEMDELDDEYYIISYEYVVS